MSKLPNRILPIVNTDKQGFKEKWSSNRNLLNLPHPFRCILTGPPGAGKSTVIKNILIRADPPFDEILVVHIDPNGSTEWNDVNGIILDELPNPTEFDRETKTALILEDLNLKQMPTEDRAKLNRLMGYSSSHLGVSIFITTQNAYDLDASIRRMGNLFVIFKSPDINALSILSDRVGLTRKKMNHIITELLKNPHDSLWLDLTNNTPAPIRINGFDKIN